jgi:methionyl-tRNA formyltransferase
MKYIKVGLLSRINDPLFYLYKDIFSKTGIEYIEILSREKITKRTSEIYESRYKKLLLEISNPENSNNNEYIYVSKHDSYSAIDKYKSSKFDILVNCGVGKKLNTLILEATGFGVISCHPGKLPNYRGSTCPEWALLNNDEIYNSIFLMSEEYDSGPIYGSQKVNINWNWTYEEFRCEVLVQGISFLAEVVNKIVKGQINVTDFEINPLKTDTRRTISEDILSQVIIPMFAKSPDINSKKIKA